MLVLIAYLHYCGFFVVLMLVWLRCIVSCIVCCIVGCIVSCIVICIASYKWIWFVVLELRKINAIEREEVVGQL